MTSPLDASARQLWLRSDQREDPLGLRSFHRPQPWPNGRERPFDVSTGGTIDILIRAPLDIRAVQVADGHELPKPSENFRNSPHTALSDSSLGVLVAGVRAVVRQVR